MGLVVDIRDIDDSVEEDLSEDEFELDEDELDEVTEESEEKDKEQKNIKLTDFTIKKYNKRLDELKGKNEYLEKALLGIELYGKINIFDRSKEILEVNKLAKWSKDTAHEKEAYKDVKIRFFDNNNEVYDKMHFKNGFVVVYKESFDEKEGNGEFYVFIREFLDKIEVPKKAEKKIEKIIQSTKYYDEIVLYNNKKDVNGVLVAIPDDNKNYVNTTACYIQYLDKYRFSNQKKVREEKTDDLKSYISCFDNNLPIYDSKSAKYVIDTTKYAHNTIELIQHYILFKTELILRKYDSIMVKHYKNWLQYDLVDDITTDFKGLCSENLNLILSIKNKFMNATERNTKEFIFGDLFFADLVYTNHIWDLKNRDVEISLSESEKNRLIRKIGETAFKESLTSKIYIGSNQYIYNLIVEPYGKNFYMFNGQIKSRDYYGNFFFGYVGYTYYSYMPNPLGTILTGASMAQIFSTGKPDPEEDKNAIKDGALANPYYKKVDIDAVTGASNSFK